jgi:hypothetical protein
VLRHVSDLDLLLFLRGILGRFFSTEHLAAFLGYGVKEIAASELLVDGQDRALNPSVLRMECASRRDLVHERRHAETLRSLLAGGEPDLGQRAVHQNPEDLLGFGRAPLPYCR